MKLTNAPRGARQSVLVFGPPKTGKTQIVSLLAAKHKLIWFDLENGHATLFKLPPEAQENVELISLADTRSYPIAIETCLKVIKGGKCAICEAHGKIDCGICKKSGAPFTNVELNALDSNSVVVFDSLTQLTNSAISHITKDKPDDYKLDFTDWGNLGKLMDVFLSHVQQAKFNVVCISHETEVELEDGKVKLVPTAGTKNFSRNTAKYFGHCIYAQVSNLKHKFTSGTTSTMNIMVGSRTDVTLEKMNEPSLESIFAGGGNNILFKEQPSKQNEPINPTTNTETTDAQTSAGETKDESNSSAQTSSNATPGSIAASNLVGLAARLAAKRKEAAG